MDRLTIRRKLLQGSLSAPLVLTVTAAGAQARTTFGACLAATANQVPPMERLAEITGTDAFGNKLWQDTWYRTIVPLTKVAYQGNSGNKPDEYYIPQKGTGKYFKLDASNPYTVSPTSLSRNSAKWPRWHSLTCTAASPTTRGSRTPGHSPPRVATRRFLPDR